MTLSLDTLKGLGAKVADNSASTQKKQLGQAEFLKLMTTQLTHQDPLKPMQNGEFLSQMAQFGTVSGIQDLQNSFKDFSASITSDQALQAASLVGRSVSVPANTGLLGAGGSINGRFEIPAGAENIKLEIQNPQTSEVVKTINFDVQSAGNVPFSWDGMDEYGNFADPGVYQIKPTAQIDGVNTALQTEVAAKVDSVSLGNAKQGVQVNLAGLGTVSFNQIKQIL